MSNLAISAAPPPAAANAGNGAAPASGEAPFGDALRQTQSRPETQADGHSADDKTAAPKHADHAPAGHADDKSKGAKAPPGDVNPQPIPIPAVPVMAAAMRQAPAASGKPVPVATAPLPAGLAGTAKAATAHAAPATTLRPPDIGNTALAAPEPATVVETQLTADTGAHTDPEAAKDAAPIRLDPGHFTGQLAQLVGAHAAPAANTLPAPVQLAMQATPQQPQQFAQETAQHVSWLAGQGIQKAEIQLNPGKLGPIHVEIATHHDRVDVTFAVQHPQTVNALQQTLPQLQHMLAQHGLNLGQASVGQQAPGQQHAAFAQHPGAGNSGGTTHAEPEPPPAWRTLRIATPGRVDDFA